MELKAKETTAALTLGALGVVFGDIGTSPLYTIRECLATLPVAQHSTGVLGILSLVFWSLVLVVSIKYAIVVLRADNRGEGGIFALLALSRLDRGQGFRIGIGTIIVLAGAAMLCGEAIITPAITVLSACEGLKFLSPGIDHYVIPVAIGILAGLFAFQKQGTDFIGKIFGPVMLLWFIVLGGLGLWQIVKSPWVLSALNPAHGYRLLLTHPHLGVLLGSVVLAITGVEALYADLGHFGRKAITRAWYGLVLPGLTLNYFGQGAYVLRTPEHAENTFLALAPAGAGRLGLLILSGFAAVIASQALISGAFSLVRQAIQLGYFPRLMVRHTNPTQRGQIYLPLVNASLAIGSITMVLGFRSSSNLAAAYGIAVTATMIVTTLTLYVVMRRTWRWKIWQAAPVCSVFLVIDVIFFSANLHKFVDGGWLPMFIAIFLLAIMTTWKKGKMEIYRRVYANEVTEDEMCNVAQSDRITRVRGTAVFMAGTSKGTPLVLLHHVKANKVLHDTVVLLTITTEEVPFVADSERCEIRELRNGIWRAIGRYGYMESPDVENLMETLKDSNIPIKLNEATYFFNREMIITGGDSHLWAWQKHLYGFLSRNARQARDYYKLPPMQIIEVGLPIQL